MKKAIGCLTQVALVLALAAFFAVPLACIATATAPMHTPQLAEKFVCPPNTQINAEWYQASWNHPGEKTLSVTCVDSEGGVHSTLPQDEKLWLAGMQVYFPYIFAPVLVVGVLILLGLNLAGMALGSLWKKLTPSKEK